MALKKLTTKVNLDTKELDSLISRFKGAKRVYADLGYFDEGSQEKYEGLTLAEVAAANEFGVEKSQGGMYIPPRPFFRGTLFQQNNFLWWFQARAGDLFNKKVPLSSLMTSFAKIAVGYFKETIESFDNPPNAPYTVQQKGKDDPLIETGGLLSRFRYRIRRISK